MNCLCFFSDCFICCIICSCFLSDCASLVVIAAMSSFISVMIDPKIQEDAGSSLLTPNGMGIEVAASKDSLRGSLSASSSSEAILAWALVSSARILAAWALGFRIRMIRRRGGEGGAGVFAPKHAPNLQEDVGSSLLTPNGTDVEARFSKDSSVRGIKFSLPESTPGAAGGTCVAKVFDEDVVKNLLEIDGVEGGGGSATGFGEKPAMVKRLVSCFGEGVRSKKKKPQKPLADLSGRELCGPCIEVCYCSSMAVRRCL